MKHVHQTPIRIYGKNRNRNRILNTCRPTRIMMAVFFVNADLEAFENAIVEECHVLIVPVSFSSKYKASTG